jgi:hypothetical protein
MEDRDRPLGDIRSSSGTEALMLIFMPLTSVFPDEYFNYHMIRERN